MPSGSMEAARPITMPGRLISSGMKRWSRSTAATSNSAAVNVKATSAWGVSPKVQRASPARAPAASSTSGYRDEIGSAQVRQRARSRSHDTTGMLSYQAMRRAAARAARARADDRLVGRNAMDADVEKAADAGAERDAHQEHGPAVGAYGKRGHDRQRHGVISRGIGVNRKQVPKMRRGTSRGSSPALW